MTDRPLVAGGRVCAACVLALGCATTIGCDETARTELVVAVTTDLVTGVDYDRITLRVDVPSKRTLDVGKDMDEARETTATLALEWKSGALGPVVVRAAAELDRDEVVATVVETEFVRRKSLLLEMRLSRACLDVPCDAGETCREGTCALVYIDGEDLPLWTGHVPGVPGVGGRADGGGDSSDADDAGSADVDGPPDADGGGTVCACSGDVNGDGVHSNGNDLSLMIDCLRGRPEADCTRADLDCSGSLTACDWEIVHCFFKVFPNCCLSTTCGACCSANGCTRDTFAGCVSAGGSIYLGAGTSCGEGTCDDVLSKPVWVTAGGDHSCALLGTGDGYCWGGNGSGELGVGDLLDAAAPELVSSSVGFAQLSAGASTTCGVTAMDGSVYCWGGNLEGQAVPGSADAAILEPSNAGGLETAVAVAAGGLHTCALGVSGRPFCWGDDTYGQLGDGAGAAAPPVYAMLESAVALAGGLSHTCALAEYVGQVSCWGKNTYGALGTGDTANQDAPLSIDFTATQICAGSGFTCAADAFRGTDFGAGAVFCWGNNANFQTGQAGVGIIVSSPALVGLPAGTAISVACGGSHACALLVTGEVYCWGLGQDGQLGRDLGGESMDASAAPVLLIGDTLPKAIGIAAGYSHSCALLADGSVYCWGDNRFGQLGNAGAGPETYTPQRAM